MSTQTQPSLTQIVQTAKGLNEQIEREIREVNAFLAQLEKNLKRIDADYIKSKAVIGKRIFQTIQRQNKKTK